MLAVVTFDAQRRDSKIVFMNSRASLKSPSYITPITFPVETELGELN